MKTLFSALRSLLLLTAITGLVYPLLVTGLSKTLFAHQASGSLLRDATGKPIGSSLVAQEFHSPRYFWPRPSAAAFATVASGASNLGPTSQALKKVIAERAASLREAHGLPATAPVPDELVQASGSGLDPHISVVAARFQLQRVCAARGVEEARVAEMIGQGLVNVLELNVALDKLR